MTESTRTERNVHHDRLALGVNCPRCRVGVLEHCRTNRTYLPTKPHSERIARARKLGKINN